MVVLWRFFFVGSLLGRLGGLMAVLRDSVASWVPRGDLLGPLGVFFFFLGGGILEASCGHQGAILKPSRGLLGSHGRLLPWGHLGGYRSKKRGAF